MKVSAKSSDMANAILNLQDELLTNSHYLRKLVLQLYTTDYKNLDDLCLKFLTF